MPTYTIGTRIDSNVAPEQLLYDLHVWRMDATGQIHTLLEVGQQPLQSNYETQKHTSQDTLDALSVIYIMEVTLYRKMMLKLRCVTPEPFTRMYTLQELSTDRAWSSTKRENPYYFETTGELRPVSEGDNTRDLTLSIRERAFIAKEYPVGDPRDPFEKFTIEDQIEERLAKASFPYQGGASLCGPAAFFYCLQVDRPDVYTQAARELWRYGKTKIGDLEITPGKGCRRPSGEFYYTDGSAAISGLDWMTLAGLRDSENTIIGYDAVNSPMAGITMWGKLSEWFEKAGYQKVFSNVSAIHKNVQDIRTLNEFVHQGCWVVTLINDGLLQLSDSNLTVPTHWIVWRGPLKADASGTISLELFSWGKVKDWLKPDKNISFVTPRFFGGMVFRPLK